MRRMCTIRPPRQRRCTQAARLDQAARRSKLLASACVRLELPVPTPLPSLPPSPPSESQPSATAELSQPTGMFPGFAGLEELLSPSLSHPPEVLYAPAVPPPHVSSPPLDSLPTMDGRPLDHSCGVRGFAFVPVQSEDEEDGDGVGGRPPAGQRVQMMYGSKSEMIWCATAELCKQRLWAEAHGNLDKLFACAGRNYQLERKVHVGLALELTRAVRDSRPGSSAAATASAFGPAYEILRHILQNMDGDLDGTFVRDTHTPDKHTHNPPPSPSPPPPPTRAHNPHPYPPLPPFAHWSSSPNSFTATSRVSFRMRTGRTPTRTGRMVRPLTS
ncbi:hypothetical protein T492DRAFT_1113374 [Pavlovales sp. CCMP2436]|nr:hypothetical protein T492DRAFT_1113374 [Pavlovales sp. CCMP2436]